MDRELPPAENRPSTSPSSERAESAVGNRGVQKANEEYGSGLVGRRKNTAGREDKVAIPPA
jgi:hypothetical protein